MALQKITLLNHRKILPPFTGRRTKLFFSFQKFSAKWTFSRIAQKTNVIWVTVFIRNTLIKTIEKSLCNNIDSNRLMIG